MKTDYRERYDNMPAVKQREVRSEVMSELKYRFRSSFYALINGNVKRITLKQSDVLNKAFEK